MKKTLNNLSKILLISTPLLFLGCTNNSNLVKKETKSEIVPVKTSYEYGNKENSISQLIIQNTFNDEVVGNIVINIDSYPFQTEFDLCQQYNSYSNSLKDVSHIKPCPSKIVVNNLRQSYSMFIKEQRLNLHNKTKGTVSLVSRSSNPNFILKYGEDFINLGESEETNYFKNESFKRQIVFKVLN